MIYKIGNWFYLEKVKILDEIKEELKKNEAKYLQKRFVEGSWIRFFFYQNNLDYDYFKEFYNISEDPQVIEIEKVYNYIDHLYKIPVF